MEGDSTLGLPLRSHEASRYVRGLDDEPAGARHAAKGTDKQTLEVAALLRPEPGKTLAHVEFDRYGRHARPPACGA